MKSLKAIILMLSLITVFFLVYSPHFSYKYPLHVDEWQHLARSIHFLESKELFVNPYFAPNLVFPEEVYHPDFEPGFHIFLAGFFYITKLDPILFYRFFPAIFATLAAFILFYLMHYLTKNFYISIFSILFFAGLKSNINISGVWFFTPLTFGIPFIFLFLFVFFKLLDYKNNKFLILALLTFLTLFFIHPISAILIYLVMVLYLLINYKKKDFVAALPLILSPLIIFIFFILIIWKEPFSNLKFFFLDWLILEEGWGYIELKYFLPFFYNIIPFSLAIIGVYPAIKNQRLRFFVILFLITAFLIFFFHNFKFSILFPYQRILYYSALSLVPLSAVGLYFIFDSIKKYKILIASSFVLVLFSIFYNYYDMPKESQLYYVIDKNDYNALVFLQQFSPSVVMAPLQQSTAVYPISKNYVVAMTKANLPGRDTSIVKDFYSNNCEVKQQIIKNNNIKYVLSKTKLDCSFLKEIYNKEDYIYKI